MDCPKIQPQEMVEVQLPVKTPTNQAAEYHLKVSFRLKDVTSWASAGYEVAWDQFHIPFIQAARPEEETANLGDLKLVSHENSIQVSGDGFTLEFDPTSGAWIRYFVSSTEIITQPFLPNFWRVPVDNDGDALLVNVRIPKFFIRILLPWLRWKDAVKKRKLLKFDIVQQADGKIKVISSFKIPGGRTPLELTYMIFRNGQVEVSYRFTPKKKLLRAGLQTQIPATFRQITWFGRGPHESMLDRKSGYAVGIYELDIEDFVHNYVRPQENANRSDVRWARLTDKDGRGIEFRSTSSHLLNFSAWPYSMVDLEIADHIHELPRRDFITLNIDYAQKGVGDLTSALMGLPDDAQLLENDTCEFSFLINPLWQKNI
jgi:beta-galactosidase